MSQPSPASNATAPAAAKPAAHGHSRRNAALLLLLAVIVVGGILGWPHITFYLTHETTDDAYLDGHLYPVLSRAAGYVTQLDVRDNEHVEAGQTLLQIDTRDYDAKIAQAKAALAQAKANLASKETFIAVVQASIRSDAFKLQNTEANYARDQALAASGALDARTLAQSKTDVESGRATHEELESQVDAVRGQIDLAKAQIKVSEAELAAAELQRSYTVVRAPAAGFISRRAVEAGQYVIIGQPLLAVTADQGVWITANFKETQLTRMRPDQPVTFTIDTYPGRTFRGHVGSLAGATGAVFALLPPDNATGNFVKITQRLPVKILIDPPTAGEPPLPPLRLGLSVVVSVATQSGL